MTALEIKNLFFSYTEQPLLQNISLSLATGQIGALLGSSGSGKTSLLRCIAGFERPAAGTIRMNDTILSAAPHQRNIGYLFQSLALFPHMNVEQNICYGLSEYSAEQKEQRLQELFSLIDLKKHRYQYPQQLSGGEKQRVALARALAPQPSLILMDEPFSSLDPDLKSHLRSEIKELLKKLKMSALIVTHDYDDAFELADYVGQLKNGTLLDWSSTSQFFELVQKQVPRIRK